MRPDSVDTKGALLLDTRRNAYLREMRGRYDIVWVEVLEKGKISESLRASSVILLRPPLCVETCAERGGTGRVRGKRVLHTHTQEGNAYHNTILSTKESCDLLHHI